MIYSTEFLKIRVRKELPTFAKRKCSFKVFIRELFSKVSKFNSLKSYKDLYKFFISNSCKK